jgi:hypothetical protein
MPSSSNPQFVAGSRPVRKLARPPGGLKSVSVMHTNGAVMLPTVNIAQYAIDCTFALKQSEHECFSMAAGGIFRPLFTGRIG